MSRALILFVLAASCALARGAVLDFNLSPPGSSPAIGLSPLNEVIPGLSGGSGNEIGNGIFFDTSTLILTLNIGYGSGLGFSDLTGPAFSWLLHGPSIAFETAPVTFDLAPLHMFATDPARGGRIVGTLNYTPAQAADLLAGLHYINIYTPGNPGGEIRGQLVLVPEPSVVKLSVIASGAFALVALFRPRRRSRRPCD